MKNIFIPIALILMVLGGYLYFSSSKDSVNDKSTNETSNTTPTTRNNDPENKTETSTATSFSPTGTKIASNYYQFSTTDYEAARLAKKPIFLYFYANWCPTCAAQEPIVRQLMDQISDESKLDDFVAFRVNFNDSDTDKDETALSKTFGVSYQHTMFVLDENGTQIKKLLGQTNLEALKSALLLAV